MATARPLVNVFDAKTGEKSSSLELPGVFKAPIRKDVVHFVHTNMAKNSRQAHAVNPQAGHQTSAESWGTGRAVARIPRVAGGGTHRSGQGAFGNMCRGGRMFAPIKTWRKWHRKINVNQRRYALTSALAASAVPALVMARGHKVDNLEEVPLVVDNLEGNVRRTKEAIDVLQKFGAYEDVEHSAQSRRMRSGKGKMRNRRYVMRRGPLVVYKDDPAVERAFRNLPGVELCHVDRLNLLQLAPGGHLGRFCVWTKNAFERLGALYGSQNEKAELKSNYHLPQAPMTNADLARIINSPAIQQAIRPPQSNQQRALRKKNPLRNRGVMAKLNPHSIQRRREEIRKAQNVAERRQKAAQKSRTEKARQNASQRRLASTAFFDRLINEEWLGGTDKQVKEQLKGKQ